MTLRVPKDKLNVSVQLEGGAKIDGMIFLEESPYMQQIYQRVISFLEDENQFFPLILDNGKKVEFINKTNVMMMECEYQDEQRTDDFYMAVVHIENVTAIFADGTRISGALMAEVPEDKARLSDCLNLSSRFLKLRVDEKFFFINKNQLQKVLYADKA